MASIYIIENKDTGKRYVGKTVVDPIKRWSQHKHCARSYNNMSEDNTARSMQIVRAMNKHGIDNFTFYVIETVDDDVVNEREKYWIKKFDTYYNGYNCTFGGEGAVRDIELAYHPNTKPVSCYTLEGVWVRDYKSRGCAARDLNITSKGGIVACIKGTTFQCGGYRWSWKDGELKDIKRRENVRGKIYGIHKDGTRKVWNSQADCAEDITGRRKNNVTIRISIISPNDKKCHCKGWYLFREDVEEFTIAQKNKFTSEQARQYGLASKGRRWRWKRKK